MLGVNSGMYKLVFILHLLAVVVGFGAVFLDVFVGRAPGRQRGADLVPGQEPVQPMWFMYAVPILGFALVGLSDGHWKFTQLWVWLSLLLWFVAVGMLHGMRRPALRQLAGAADGAQATQLEQRASAAAAAIDVILVIVVVLMVWKPGS
jgi:uncharacterized membrane protein